MELQVKEVSAAKRSISAILPAEKVDQEFAKQVTKATKHARIDGFRPGKVPSRLIKQRYGKQLRHDAVWSLIETDFFKSLEAQKIVPISQPVIDVTVNEAGKDVEFVADFEVYPKFKVEGFDKLNIEKQSATVKADDIKGVLKRIQKQHATWKEVKDAIDQDDKVAIDIEGKIDNKAFPGGTATDMAVEIGSKGLIPGFEEGLVGHKTGDEFSLDLTFPKDYGQKDLAGKPVVFAVKVKKVERAALPKLDADFAKKLEVNSIEELQTQVEANMKRELRFNLQNKLKDKVIDDLVALNDIEVPQAMIEREQQMMKQRMKEQFNLSDEQLEKMNFSGPEFDGMMAETTANIKKSMLMSQLIEQLSLKLDEKLFEENAKMLAEAYEDPKEAKENFMKDQKHRDQLEQMVLEIQAIDEVLKTAKVTEKKVGFFDIIDQGYTPMFKQA